MNFQILQFNGEKDHIHVLIEYPPKLSISVIVNSLKGVSSRRYGQAGYFKPYNQSALLSPSYFVSPVGTIRSVKIIYPKSRKAVKDGVLNPFF